MDFFMDARQLIDHWKPSQVFRFDEDTLKRKHVDENAIYLLTRIGLPQEAAPFLSFGGNYTNESPMPIDVDQSGLIEIGVDGAGNAICIDNAAKGTVIVCQHDDEFSKQYMNRSVLQLLHFITIYKDFVEKLNREKGDFAYLDANFTDDELQHLVSSLKSIDGDALIEGTFWSDEIETMQANRKFYQRENR
jgi:hypothetical protein